MSEISKLYILIVEDMTTDAFIAKRVMKMACPNIEVKHAVNGEHALEIISHESIKPSLILLDINMPTMNGIEFLDTLSWSKEEKEKTVVILSSSVNIQDKTECHSLGILQYIEKPISLDNCKQALYKTKLLTDN